MFIAKAIQIIKILNEITINHLSAITEKDWNCYYIDHPERGKGNLESLVKKRISHIHFHAEYIERNISLFNEIKTE